jgi:putative glutamine amidotransferase
MTSTSKPLIGLPSDTYEKDGLLYHSIGDKYLRAVHDVAHCAPVMIPSLGDDQDVDAILDRLDGVIMTGATSNVHPPHFGEQPTTAHEPYDHHRDSSTLRLIRKVLDRKMPLFCICRGFQELNVVFGGTLATEIQETAGRLDHRSPESDDLDVRYGPAHPIDIRKGGLLHRILDETAITVNTVHRQGIARLADGLTAEAHAPDGVVEAVSIDGAGEFALGVQWHPEYKAAGNPHSIKLFEAYGDAARAYALRRSRQVA